MWFGIILRTVIDVPFGGLFQAGLPLPHRFDGGLRWEFPANDLNASAKALFHHLDRVFEILRERDFAFLSTIELDVEEGRFPDVLAQYFGDEARMGTQSFFVAPIKSTPASGCPAGRLTFEAAPGQTVRVLGQNGGFRWGSQLRVWGLQVPEDHMADALEASTDDPELLRTVEKVARAAWLASDDLDVLGLWISPSVSQNARKELASL
jgi:hypothetical protein